MLRPILAFRIFTTSVLGPSDYVLDASGIKTENAALAGPISASLELQLQSSTNFPRDTFSTFVFFTQQPTMLRVAVVRGNVGLEQALRTGVRRQWRPRRIRQPVKVRASNVLREEKRANWDCSARMRIRDRPLVFP